MFYLGESFFVVCDFFCKKLKEKLIHFVLINATS